MRRSSILAPAALLLACGIASANVGTGLPLDQYQAGTEITNNTIVTNGNFESVTSGNPNGWTLNNSHQVGAPVGANTGNNGAFSAQGNLGAADPGTGFNGYSQTVTLAPSTTYVLSAYMWNFGQNFDLEVVELRDSTDAFVTNIALTANDAAAQDPMLILDGARGVFGYTGFNSGAGGTFTLLTKFDLDEAVAGTRPNIAGQVDNIAITPISQFRPPNLIPEPASLSMLLAAGAALRRRR